MDDDTVVRYEPQPRWGHISVTVGSKVYMWGGRTEDFSEDQKKKLANSVEVFDCNAESWVTRNTSGTPPKGLYNTAYAVQGSTLYVYGGWDGLKAHNSLHQLNLKTFAWSEVKVQNPSEAPAKMSGCGIVAYGNRKLVLFGGYGVIKKKEKKTKEKAKESKDSSPGAEGKDASAENTNSSKLGEAEKEGAGDGEKDGEDKKAENRGENGVAGEEGNSQGTAESGEVDSAGAKSEEGRKEEGGGEGEGGGTEKKKGGVEEEKGGGMEGKENGVEEGEGGEGAKGKEADSEESREAEETEKDKETAEDSKDGAGEKKKRTQDSTTEATQDPVEVESKQKEKDEGDKMEEGVKTEEAAQSNGVAPEIGEGEEATPTEEEKTLGNGVVAVAKDEEEVEKGEDEEEEESSESFSIYKREDSDDKGWINEVKVFDLDHGTWTSQPTTGCVPPPCVDFSFTCVDGRRAVVFGGYQPQTGITNDTYLIDMDTWIWTKLSGPDDSQPDPPSSHVPYLLLQPSARDGHAACVVDGEPRPLLLVTGGWDAMDHALQDMWVLDINSGLWSELSVSENMGCRFWHTTVVSRFSSRMRQVLTFGGCPGAPESHTTGAWPKMAGTFIMEMGKVPSLPTPFTNGAGTEDGWVVVDTVSMEQLGDPTRRLRETVLLTAYRAQRAEQLIHNVMKKVDKRPLSAPKTKVENGVHLPGVLEEAEEVEQRPFWQKSLDDIQMTYEEIGRGRFSVVKVAIYHETRVAVRCLLNRINSEENRKVFTECLEMAAKLRHPNLVSFMGAILDREPVIITELMPFNLRSILEKNPLTYYQLVDISSDVAKALEFLHSVKPEPVIHGELTGTSVLLEGGRGPRWKAKLSDYMSAKYFHHLMSSITPSSSIEDVFSPIREHPSQEYKPRRKSRSASPFDAVKLRTSPDRTTKPTSKFLRKASTMSSTPLDMGLFSTERDVYLYGILLVEMSTRTAVLEVSLQYLIESIAWPQIAVLVKKCLTAEPEQRPRMDSVLSHVMQLAASKP